MERASVSSAAPMSMNMCFMAGVSPSRTGSCTITPCTPFWKLT